jgi:MazG family protein
MTPNRQVFLDELQRVSGVEKLLRVTARLRHPTEGCPWDLKQTHQSLKRYMLEEAYEAIEAMDSPDHPDGLQEELGDVLLQVALHSRLAEEAGRFDFEDVCEGVAEKLIRRHPHVFGEADAQDADAVTRQWERIKRAEKNQALENQAESGPVNSDPAKTSHGAPPESVLAGISRHQPALSRALETSRRAVKVGFEWPDLDALWACVMSEYDEFRAEVDALPASAPDSDSGRARPDAAQFDRLESEMGDILFASVNLAREFNIDPEVALTRATAKFTRRFQIMEALILEEARQNAGPGGLPDDFSLPAHMAALDFETWDRLWTRAKAQ